MKKLVYLDCCFPDYFAGSSLPTLAVCIWHGITGRELKEAIINEYYVMGYDIPKFNIEKAADEFVMNEDDERLFEWLEPEECDCYLYIGIVEDD